jgi:2-polyprenyl-6-methoxyphenol hydroxylase-like FAD-dependent oxidoreductase
MSAANTRGRRALIVGGGIGGLAAALSLAARQFEVDLFERASEFREIGAGIQLGPNSIRALQALNVSEPIAQKAVYPDALVMMDAVDGREIARIETGLAFRKRFGAPYGVIHRADLHGELVAACIGTPSIRLRTGHAVEGFSDQGDHVSANTSVGTFDGDLLIGADGLWSNIRQHIAQDGPPRRSGHIAYRAVLKTEDVPPHLRRNEMVLWAGPKCHLVHYPLRGGHLFNLVAVFHSDRYEEGWNSFGDPQELQARFANVHVDVRVMLGKIEEWRMWVLCDREPTATWSRGRVTLLGDAAHPMLQYLAQGAGMALEDAVCLGQLLADPEVPIPTALVTYQNARCLRSGRAQLTARLYGEFYHAAGVRRDIRNAFLSSGMNSEGLAWLYDPQPSF